MATKVGAFKMRTAIGVDPDTHSTGLALVQDISGRPVLAGVGVIRIKPELTGQLAANAMCKSLVLKMCPLFLEWGFLLTTPAIVAIESQRLVSVPGKRHQRPEDILRLANVSGAAVATFAALLHDRHTYLPQPQEWKGQVPKHIQQARSYAKLGIPCQPSKGRKGVAKDPYMVPVGLLLAQGLDGPFKPNPGDWKHVGDAIGLALWALEQ